eukprot:8270495-Alexandrium_andersonii.AAC.1
MCIRDRSRDRPITRRTIATAVIDDIVVVGGCGCSGSVDAGLVGCGASVFHAAAPAVVVELGVV